MAETKLAPEEKLLRMIFCGAPGAYPPRYEVDGVTLRQAIERALLSLDHTRRAQVLRLRSGFDGEPMTLSAVGKVFNVTPERIRQIEGRALRELRRPRCSRALKAYLSLD